MCLKMIVVENTYVFGFVMENLFNMSGIVFQQVQCYTKY
jgi:hypothetical protein